MRIASFERNEMQSFGAVVEDAIVDLGGMLDGCPSLRSVLENDRLDELMETSRNGAEKISLTAVRLLPPIPFPEKIICVGVNYANRNEEYRDGSETPRFPSLFVRFPGSFVGHDVPIIRPTESRQFDYEGEIAIIIGAGGRRIPASKAGNHIAGLALANDGTLRDWVRHAKFNVTQGKNFDRSGAIGPWMTTADSFDGFDNLDIETRVSGEIRQKDNTRNLLFSFSELIEYISTFATLRPGDTILTGTPTGSGARFDPPRFLSPGDIVEVSSPQIGVLKNQVIKET